MTDTSALFKATHGIVTFKIENQEYCTSLDIIDSIIKSKELNQLAYLSGERIVYKSEKYKLIDHFRSGTVSQLKNAPRWFCGFSGKG